MKKKKERKRTGQIHKQKKKKERSPGLRIRVGGKRSTDSATGLFWRRPKKIVLLSSFIFFNAKINDFYKRIILYEKFWKSTVAALYECAIKTSQTHALYYSFVADSSHHASRHKLEVFY